MEKRYTPDTKISELSGVGKVRCERLGHLGIHTVRDLIYYFPRSYENRGDVSLLGSFDTENMRSYILTVASTVSSSKIKGNLTISRFRAFDDSGSVEVIFFNSPYVKEVFEIGATFRFYGKLSFNKNRRFSLVNPKYEAVIDGMPLDDYLPVYTLTEGISSKILAKLIKSAVDDVLPLMDDPLPEEVRTSRGLATLGYAIKNAHFPIDNDALWRARRRLAFDEMFYFGLGIAVSASRKSLTPGVTFAPCSLQPFTDMLPYELTGAQKKAINDVYRDTVIKRVDGITPAMARILVGDVGCGKTVCAAAAIYIAFKSGYQSALMVPTEILAIQHFSDLSELLGGLGVRCALLTGSVTAARKKAIYNSLAFGEIDLVIGTHALLSDKVTFNKLGLIVTDEQHRFGVEQRAVLKERTSSAHMLVMSATPIPRTLALALYGDLDISRIDEMPKGRQRVDTFVVDESYRTRINSFIDKQIRLGGQCYIVCPSIEAEEDAGEEYIPSSLSTSEMVACNSLNLKSAVDYAEEIRAAFPHCKVECLHGRLKNAEKDRIMSSFASGETHILVSTTVIEVGVNVPNATLMIVENAERFGLSQLHQLRGRVGRGSRKSYCILVSDLKTEKAQARLEVMRSTYDGYEIAEKDLLLRGPGDFFSSYSGDNIRQSGGFEFHFASSCDDGELFDSAFSAAREIAKRDPELLEIEHVGLRIEMSRRILSVSDIS